MGSGQCVDEGQTARAWLQNSVMNMSLVWSMVRDIVLNDYGWNGMASEHCSEGYSWQQHICVFMCAV
eukprot:3553325-Lingulodinium_polyedra.AAC.1